MGITIAYRGRLADLERVEDFEDRVLDFALEYGGMAQIWRSGADDRPERVVRGVIVDLAPGMEAVSLLVSPEGWLIGLVDIKDAEQGQLTEMPWCCVKTQFGPLEGHVALVEMLAALRREFILDLEVSDESGYWETRDVAALAQNRALLQSAIDGLAEALQRHGLSREAAEDPEILAMRIERIAALVQRTLLRPAEHAPVSIPYDDPVIPPDMEDPDEWFEDFERAAEALDDAMFKHNRRQQERLTRAIEERRRRGESDEEALENAMRDIGLELPGEDGLEKDELENEDSWLATEDDPFDDDDFLTYSTDEEDDSNMLWDEEERDDDCHPLLEQAMDFLQRLDDVSKHVEPQFQTALHTLFQGAGDMMGGLAQALSPRLPDDDRIDSGLRITQFKRALRGAAFARGALFNLRPAIAAATFDELHRTVRQMEQDIFTELSRERSGETADGGEW